MHDVDLWPFFLPGQAARSTAECFPVPCSAQLTGGEARREKGQNAFKSKSIHERRFIADEQRETHSAQSPTRFSSPKFNFAGSTSAQIDFVNSFSASSRREKRRNGNFPPKATAN
jgi:hypothetical protein